MKRLILLSFTTCLLTGCGMYKNYYRPEVKTDSLYRNIQTTDTVSLANLSWYELFTDNQLQELIKLGLVNNTDLKIARLRIDEAKAILTKSRLSYLPEISLNPEGTISNNNGDITKVYNLGMSASWEIDIFGKVTNAKRKAHATLEADNAYKQAVQTQLIATIADSYYTLLLFDEQLSINKLTFETWKQTVEIQKKLKKAGASNDAAILQAEANCMTLEAAILSLKEHISETENSLSALLAITPQTIKRGVLNKQSFPDTLSVGIPLQLLSKRPDVRQAEFVLAQAFYATNEARAAFYPNLTLSGVAGWTNSAGNVILNPGTFLINSMVALMQPLFNKGTNMANLKMAKAQQEAATLSFQQVIIDAGKEVNNALIQWQTSQQRIEVSSRQIETLQKLVHKTQLLMQYSSTNYLEVLVAQQSLLAAKLTQSQNQFDRIQGIIKLYHALGGGL